VAQGDAAGAVPYFEEALRLNPAHTQARIGLANALVHLGRSAEAIPLLQRAVREAPDDRIARNNLGILLADAGRGAEARPHLERARTLAERDGVPLSPHARRALGDALAEAGEPDRALDWYERALRARPEDPVLLAKAGLMAHITGRPQKAVAHYRAALARDAALPDVANNLAWLLATCDEDEVRDPQAALALAASQPSGDRNAGLLDTLAASQAAVGRYEDALRTSERAVAAARAAGDEKLAADAEAHRAVYAGGRALREPCARR
jgi:tetratricopeptide (TPR) repeat protein